jgi:hypothetical protein
MMLTILECAGLALALVLLIAIHRRLSRLPLAVWSLARREREAEAPKALDAMREAVAVKAATSVIAIRQYEENIAASFRAQMAEAEMRARIGERRAVDVVTALQAATTLVHELRAALDALPASPGMRAVPPSTLPAGDGERETTETPIVRSRDLPSAVAEEDDPEGDDLTRVEKRPRIPPPSGDAPRALCKHPVFPAVPHRRICARRSSARGHGGGGRMAAPGAS